MGEAESVIWGRVTLPSPTPKFERHARFPFVHSDRGEGEEGGGRGGGGRGEGRERKKEKKKRREAFNENFRPRSFTHLAFIFERSTTNEHRLLSPGVHIPRVSRFTIGLLALPVRSPKLSHQLFLAERHALQIKIRRNVTKRSVHEYAKLL